MPQTEPKSDDDDKLRGFIDRLEDWPEDDPPSPSELRALRREFRLTQDERDKLEILSENHIRRARSALDAGAYDQAAAELARASQLRPRDSRPRVELAGIYLQRSLERGYGRNDRQKAVRLARKALELNPGDIDAKNFLQEYRRMNADFRFARSRRYVLPILVIVLAIAGLFWWQQEWVVDLFDTSNSEISADNEGGVGLPAMEALAAREVPVEAPGIDDGALLTEILQARVGRRNDGSYIHIVGRLKSSSKKLSNLDLLIRGRGFDDETLFALPWTVRGELDPPLLPGDSQSLTAFRWLADGEEKVQRIELLPLNVEYLPDEWSVSRSDVDVYWESSRPEGARVAAEARNRRVVEAYDRQVVLMDVSVENTGTVELENLAFSVALGSDWRSPLYYAANPLSAPMERGERRVLSLALPLPLDAQASDEIVSLRINGSGF